MPRYHPHDQHGIEHLRSLVERAGVRGSEPRVHGNGFLQLDIDEERRMHVFGDPRIPRQRVSTQVHNHVFSFRSHVMRGRMINIPYSVFADDHHGTHRLWEAIPRDGYDTKLQEVSPERDVVVVPRLPDIVFPGQEYGFQQGVFHETVVQEVTVTLMIKTGPLNRYTADTVKPRVAVPTGWSPDDEFDRHGFDQSFLWDVISDALYDV